MASPKRQPVSPTRQPVSPKAQTVSPKDQTVRPKKKKIFLSGPMNSTSDVNGQMAISAVLKQTFNVYLAPVDGVEISSLIDLLANPTLFSELFLRAALLVQQIGWAHEIYQLLSCDALVLNMDGRVPDEGAVAEAATAYMAGKPVVIYKNTVVTFWNFFNNPMVAALSSTWQVIADVCKLPEALTVALDDPPAGKGFEYTPPPNIQEAYDFGKYVSENLRPLMTALEEATEDLPAALKGLEPAMGSMQTFGEALIEGESARSAAMKAFGPSAPSS
jgi:nucleoside 2-deoxyribosyltransferase